MQVCGARSQHMFTGTGVSYIADSRVAGIRTAPEKKTQAIGPPSSAGLLIPRRRGIAPVRINKYGTPAVFMVTFLTLA